MVCIWLVKLGQWPINRAGWYGRLYCTGVNNYREISLNQLFIVMFWGTPFSEIINLSSFQNMISLFPPQYFSVFKLWKIRNLKRFLNFYTSLCCLYPQNCSTNLPTSFYGQLHVFWLRYYTSLLRDKLPNESSML